MLYSLSVFHNLKLTSCRKQSKNQSWHIWSKMTHEHQTEYMRGKRPSYIIFQTKRLKMCKIMHFKETVQISFLTKLSSWWWFKFSKIGWEFLNIFKELGDFTFRIWWSKNSYAKWQAALYRCGCSKDKVSGKSLWGCSDMNRVGSWYNSWDGCTAKLHRWR